MRDSQHVVSRTQLALLQYRKIVQHEVCTLQVPVHVLKPLLRLTGRLGSRPLLDGHGTADGFDQLMLPMEEVRRVVRAEVMLHVGQKARLSGILRGVKLLDYQLLMSTDRRANILRSESSGAPDF